MLFKVCMWGGAGYRTLLKYFDPEVMAVSVVSFSFSMVAQPSTGVGWVLAFLTTSRLSPQLLACLPLSSIRRPYITFKLPRSNIDMPQCLRNLFRFPATGMCHFLPVHHLEWGIFANEWLSYFWWCFSDYTTNKITLTKKEFNHNPFYNKEEMTKIIILKSVSVKLKK